jgi:hypothetical protein
MCIIYNPLSNDDDDDDDNDEDQDVDDGGDDDAVYRKGGNHRSIKGMASLCRWGVSSSWSIVVLQ